jgi:hypothetical protein
MTAAPVAAAAPTAARNARSAQLFHGSIDGDGWERIPIESGRAHDRNAGLLADPSQRNRIASPIRSAQVGDRRQAEFLRVAQVIDDRLLLRLADAIGRPLLGGEIDLQVLVSENPALNGRDVSGHGSDHCPISHRAGQSAAAHFSA